MYITNSSSTQTHLFLYVLCLTADSMYLITAFFTISLTWSKEPYVERIICLMATSSSSTLALASAASISQQSNNARIEEERARSELAADCGTIKVQDTSSFDTMNDSKMHQIRFTYMELLTESNKIKTFPMFLSFPPKIFAKLSVDSACVFDPM